MTKEISLSDLKRMNMTQLVLGIKVLKDKFISQDEVRKALVSNRTILDEFDSAKGCLDDYDVVDEYRRSTCIEVFEEQGHQETKKFELRIRDGRVGESATRVTRVDFVRSDEVQERLFLS